MKLEGNTLINEQDYQIVPIRDVFGGLPDDFEIPENLPVEVRKFFEELVRMHKAGGYIIQFNPSVLPGYGKYAVTIESKGFPTKKLMIDWKGFPMVQSDLVENEYGF